ncbi:ATP-binding protein [Paracoccus onubensis]|nr:ATP-binding protein [Paracoccus onubensis]
MRLAGTGSIARRLVLAGALVSIVSGVGLGGASALADLRRGIKIATGNADRILYSATPQLERAYWDVDLMTVQAILDRLVDDPLIRALWIEDLLLSPEQLRIAQIPRFQVERPAAEIPALVTSGLVPAERLTQKREIVLRAPDGVRAIARLDVTFSFAGFYNDFAQQALRIVLTAVLQALLLAALLFLLTRRYIISPLGVLSRAAQGLREGQGFRLTGPAAGRLGSRDDEISRLAQDFARTVAQMERYRDHLREEVEQRTAELVVARNDALAASRAKSAFLANMSHELRTPLNAITGLSELLLAERLPLASRRQVTDMQSAARQLLRSIDSVLDLSKLEGGHMVFEQRPFAVDAVFDEVIAQTRVLIGAPSPQLEGDIAPAVPLMITGDRQKLTQILLNLTSNAVKFTTRGRIALRIFRRGDRLRFSVFDSGTGIAERDQAVIFDPFTQADATISREVSGTGLGLAIAQEMAEGMGGRLALRSRPDMGSLFILDLPLDPAEQAAAASILPRPLLDIPDLRMQVRLGRMLHRARMTGETDGRRLRLADGTLSLDGTELPLPLTHRELRMAVEQADAELPSSPALREKRVLVVEDRKINREVMEELLRRNGVRAVSVPGASAALTALNHQHPDAIITDLHMPEMDGIALMGRLRGRGLTIPVIASSADVSTETRLACRNAGFTAFLPKPLTGATLLDTLTTVFRDAMPVLDDAALVRNTGGDQRMAARWKARIPDEIEDWRELLAGKVPLAEALHAIRGAALQLGATELCHVVQEKPVDMPRIEAALDRLRHAAMGPNGDQSP